MQVTNDDWDAVERALESAVNHQAITEQEAIRIEILVESLSNLLNQVKGYNK